MTTTQEPLRALEPGAKSVFHRPDVFVEENTPWCVGCGYGAWSRVLVEELAEPREHYVGEAEVLSLGAGGAQAVLHRFGLGQSGDQNQRAEGAFERSFRISGGIDAAGVHAKFENGVLTITLPKPEEAKPKQTDVQVG